MKDKATAGWNPRLWSRSPSSRAGGARKARPHQSAQADGARRRDWPSGMDRSCVVRRAPLSSCRLQPK